MPGGRTAPYDSYLDWRPALNLFSHGSENVAQIITGPNRSDTACIQDDLLEANVGARNLVLVLFCLEANILVLRIFVSVLVILHYFFCRLCFAITTFAAVQAEGI